MSDFLVDLGTNKQARKLITSLGLPIPLPQKLRRDDDPWQERPLQDRPVVAGVLSGGTLGRVLARSLAAAGAETLLAGEQDKAIFEEEGAAFGRHVSALRLDEAPEKVRISALVLDATGVSGPADLEPVRLFFQSRIRSLAPCARAVVLTRPPESYDDAPAAAAARALEGFVRALAKELGRKGSTAHIAYVTHGSESRLEPLLRFLLSARSAYVTGQPFRLTETVKLADEAATIRSLEGKVALVTGAARGIGCAIAHTLAREGARVLVMDRPSEEETATRVAREIGGIALPCDVTADDAVPTVTRKLDAVVGGTVDVIVHNAGITRDKMFVNMDEERWAQVIDVNLAALIRLNEGLLPALNDGGRIICLSSIAGIAGNAGQTNYAASKAGVIGYVGALAPKLAGRGVAVNAVAPGFIETQMTARIPTAVREVARRLSALSQGGLPDDVAEVVTFLASPGAAGFCGQVVRVCGGNFIGA